MHQDIQSLLDQLDSATSDAKALIAGLSETEASKRLSATSWSIAQLLDHLALTNHLYLDAMQAAATRAREQGKMRRRPARPGLIGGWFAAKVEPPIKPSFRMKTIPKLKPESESTVAHALQAFTSSQQAIEQLIRNSADLDLSSIRYSNPIIRGMNFSIASGLHIVLAHERRHLWQSRQLRNTIQSEATRKEIFP